MSDPADNPETYLQWLGELSEDLLDMERGISTRPLRADQINFLRTFTEEILARTLSLLSPECRAFYAAAGFVGENRGNEP